jgi:polysaccharide biosynthesis protein PslJ
MRLNVLVGEDQRGPAISLAIVLVAIGLLGFTVLTSSRVEVVAPLLGAIAVIAVGYRVLLSWRSLLTLTFLVILLIPIRKYTLPSSLPFHLEPYRLVAAFIAIGWVTSLLIDRRVRLKATPIDTPLLCFFFIVLLSLIVNPDRVRAVEPDVVKKLMFFASFFILYYVIASVAGKQRDIDILVAVLAGAGSIVAVAAMVESRTGYNPFDHIRGLLPFLHEQRVAQPTVRGARLRAYASAQHPIALGAVLVMLIPLALYRAHALGKRLWWISVVLLALGALATVSRTAVVMLAIVVLVYLLLRTQETKRLWPLLIPALAVVHIVLPGTLGTLKASLFPEGGLIAQQQNAAVGSGRIATLGPALDAEWKPNPILGEGFGTRVPKADEYVPIPNGPILDNQWLGIVLETGVVGTFVFGWLIVRFLRRAGSAGKRDPSPRGWLLVGITASTAAYAVGMFTYDAFAFIQVTFMFFVLMGLGSAVLALPDPELALAAKQERRKRREGWPAQPTPTVL